MSFLVGKESEDSFADILHYMRENINCLHQIWQRFGWYKMTDATEKS